MGVAIFKRWHSIKLWTNILSSTMQASKESICGSRGYGTCKSLKNFNQNIQSDKNPDFLMTLTSRSQNRIGVILCKTGLEKLTNANRSVSSVNDRLFPVELTEIADWKSISEYMFHSNFGKALTGVIGGTFCAYTFILPLPCILNIYLFGCFIGGKNT